jgi:curved DNA-binding protein CbpA
MSPPIKDYYRILQVDPSAEPEVIAAAYKRLAFKYHPDTNKSPNAHYRMQEINEAYHVLNNPASRTEYDRARLTGASSYDRRRAAPPRRSQPGSLESTHNQLGWGCIAIYVVTLAILFSLFGAWARNIWVIAIILIAAGIIAAPIVFSLDDYLRGK